MAVYEPRFQNGSHDFIDSSTNPASGLSFCELITSFSTWNHAGFVRQCRTIFA